MTEEEKNIVLLGSRYETMNMYVDLSNDDGTISKGIAEAMQVYAERYHIAQTIKLRQPLVISSVCKCKGGAVGRTVTADFEHQICDRCGNIAN